MNGKQAGKGIMLWVIAILCLCAGTAYAATVSGGIGAIATNVTEQFAPVAKLITAGAYLAGFGFAVAAIVKFKAHKDNPTQIAISMPIALLFVAAALIGAPTIFKATGKTMFGNMSGTANTISGVSSF